jgi:hypothetical protein
MLLTGTNLLSTWFVGLPIIGQKSLIMLQRQKKLGVVPRGGQGGLGIRSAEVGVPTAYAGLAVK